MHPKLVETKLHVDYSYSVLLKKHKHKFKLNLYVPNGELLKRDYLFIKPSNTTKLFPRAA